MPTSIEDELSDIGSDLMGPVLNDPNTRWCRHHARATQGCAAVFRTLQPREEGVLSEAWRAVLAGEYVLALRHQMDHATALEAIGSDAGRYAVRLVHRLTTSVPSAMEDDIVQSMKIAADPRFWLATIGESLHRGRPSMLDKVAGEVLDRCRELKSDSAFLTALTSSVSVSYARLLSRFSGAAGLAAMIDEAYHSADAGSEQQDLVVHAPVATAHAADSAQHNEV